MAEAKKYAE